MISFGRKPAVSSHFPQRVSFGITLMSRVYFLETYCGWSLNLRVIFFHRCPADLYKHLARHNLNQRTLSRADSCQGRMSVSAFRGLKMTEHEVTGGDAPKVIICITGRPLTFPIRRSILLPENLSVTANFL